MHSFTTAFLLGLVGVVLCASNYDPSYQPQYMAPKPLGHPRPQRPRPHTYDEKPLSKEFDAEEVQNILLNSIPGKDYPIFSLDSLPQTSFKCSDSNIHYPGYYADVETGCQVFHYCPIKVEDNSYQQQPSPSYRQPSQGYPQEEEQEPQYRRKRAVYGDSYTQSQQQPATYYETPEMPPASYQPPSQNRPPVQYEQPQEPAHQRPIPQQRYEPIQPNYVEEEQLLTFICPNQTIFNQKTLTCEWFYNVVCEHAIQNYDLANSRLYHENAPLLDEIPEVEHPNNLNLSPNLQRMTPQQSSYRSPQGHRQMRPHKQLPPPSQYEDQPY